MAANHISFSKLCHSHTQVSWLHFNSLRRDGLDLHGYVPEEATFGRPTVVKDMPASKKLTTAEILAGGPGSGFIGLSGGLGTMKEILR
ncbi:hypothetical protein ACHAQD_006597 [Fusarium lateritium]